MPQIEFVISLIHAKIIEELQNGWYHLTQKDALPLVQHMLATPTRSTNFSEIWSTKITTDLPTLRCFAVVWYMSTLQYSEVVCIHAYSAVFGGSLIFDPTGRPDHLKRGHYRVATTNRNAVEILQGSSFHMYRWNGDISNSVCDITNSSRISDITNRIRDISNSVCDIEIELEISLE